MTNSAATSFALIEQVSTLDADASMNSLLADLEAFDIEGDDVTCDEVLEAADIAVIEVSATPDLLDEAIEAVEQKDAIAAVYADQSAAVNPAALFAAPEVLPGTEAAAPVVVIKKGKKLLTDEERAARDEAAAEAKAERDAKRAAAKALKAAQPKPERVSKITHTPGKLLKAKLGADAADFLVFDMTDAHMDAEQLAKKQEAFIDRMDDREAIAGKVKEKIIMLLTWLKNGGELNEVLKRTFTVLRSDGELVSGMKGNLHLNLLSKPYSVGTANSQGNQMFMALPELGICLREKGRLVPNQDSALLPAIYAKLGLM